MKNTAAGIIQYGETVNAIGLLAVGVWMLAVDVTDGYARIVPAPHIIGAVLAAYALLQFWASQTRRWLAARTMLFVAALFWCYLASSTLLWRPYALDAPAYFTLMWNAGACYVRAWRFRLWTTT